MTPTFSGHPSRSAALLDDRVFDEDVLARAEGAGRDVHEAAGPDEHDRRLVLGEHERGGGKHDGGKDECGNWDTAHDANSPVDAWRRRSNASFWHRCRGGGRAVRTKGPAATGPSCVTYGGGRQEARTPDLRVANGMSTCSVRFDSDSGFVPQSRMNCIA